MSNDNVIDYESRDICHDVLTEMVRSGARQILAQALQLEVEEFLAQYEGQFAENGLRAVVRSGCQPERDIQTGIGPVSVRIPKVRSNTGEAVSFRSALIPPYVRKTATVEAFVPWLYLKGVSSGEMADTLKVLLGSRAQGFSASSVSRLAQQWNDERRQWQQRGLSDRIVYVWADGVYCGLRAEDAKLCALVLIGVDEWGNKRLLAIEEGVRESTESWKSMLLDLKSRGMGTPKLAVGDGAMGFWSAMDQVFPESRHQRCWMHKTANVLNRLPKRLHGQAKKDLHQIWMAETRAAANAAFERFVRTYQDKYPKVAEILIRDGEELLAFYDFPALHWQSLRTTNPIESTFATIRHRTRRSKGCLTKTTMLSMMYKLGQCAEKKWRRLRGFRELGKVIEGVKFKNGIEVIYNETDQVAA